MLDKDSTQRHWLIRPTPTDLPLLVIMFMMVVSVAISPLPDRSLRAIWPLALGVALYWVIAHWPWTEDQLLWFWRGLVVAALGLCAVAPAGMVSGGVTPPLHLPLLDRYQRILGDAFNPNVIAGYLVILTPFGLARTLTRAKRVPVRFDGVERVISGLICGAAVGLTVLTRSRGGLVALSAALLVLLASRWPRAARRLMPMLAVASLILALLVDWPVVLDTLTAGGETSGMAERLEIWSRAIYITQDFPFTGLGFGCFEPVVQLMYPLFLVRSGTVPHAHNLLLQVAVDLGLTGLVAYVSLLLLTFYMLFSVLRTRTPNGTLENCLAKACIASLSGLLLHGLIDAATWGNKGAFLPWAMLGLAASIYRRPLSGRGRDD